MEKTHQSMTAVSLQLSTAIAGMTMKNSLQLSSDIMKEMNNITGGGGVGESMESLRREMARCSDAADQIDAAFQDPEEEAEAANEVQRVMEELELDMAATLHGSPNGGPVPAAPDMSVVGTSAVVR